MENIAVSIIIILIKMDFCLILDGLERRQKNFIYEIFLDVYIEYFYKHRKLF